MNTPRTDAALYAIAPRETWTKYEWIPVEFSRQLERELTAEQEKVKQLRDALETVYMRTIDIDSRKTAMTALEATK